MTRATAPRWSCQKYAGVGIVGDGGPISDSARNASPRSGADGVKSSTANSCSIFGGGRLLCSSVGKVAAKVTTS